MQGLEFVVAYDPLQAAAQSERSFAHEPSNIWVIRKQTRRKRSGLDDEVVVLSTFFVVGDCIYMAPSVASVIGNRIVSASMGFLLLFASQELMLIRAGQLSAVTSLTSLLKTASTLPSFTPSYGHTYMPPTIKSTETSQTGGKEDSTSTPMPEGESQNKASLQGATTTSNIGSTVQDTRTLAESFNLLSRYGDEFMDENPLVGEPGSFILSRSGDVDRTAAKQVPASTAASAAANAPTRVGTPQVRIETPGKVSDKGGSTPISDESKLRKMKSKIGS